MDPLIVGFIVIAAILVVAWYIIDALMDFYFTVAVVAVILYQIAVPNSFLHTEIMHDNRPGLASR